MSELIVPDTGEVLELSSAPTAKLALWLEAARDYESGLRGLKKLASDELLRRMDFDATLTLQEGDYKVTGDGPTTSEWDINALRAALAGLVAEGRISANAADNAVETITTYKPRARGLNALKKLGGEIQAAIEACELTVERQRRVRVEKVGR